MKHVFSDFAGDRLARLQAQRESALGPASEPSAEEARLRAGRDGELAVARRVLEQATEPFALASGYQSWRGELDLLLITPTVIAAIEVKTLNADIAIDGDCWVRRSRNPSVEGTSEWHEIVDEGGRSPSKQLNEAADHLERWLHRNGLRVRVQRWVVLAHDRSTVVQANDVTVDRVVRLAELDLSAIGPMDNVVPMVPIPVDRVLTLARRDHLKYVERREARKAKEPCAAAPIVRIWDPAQRKALLEELAMRAAAQGPQSPAMFTLRSAIRQDLLGRTEPSVVPALLTAFRYDIPVRELIARLAVEAMDVFEEPTRCLVMLTIPVCVRLRRFLAGNYECEAVSPGVMRAMESVARTYHRLERVAFDHRLYAPEAVRAIGPQAMRRYARDLADHGARAVAPVSSMRVQAAPNAKWLTVHVLGVAVLAAGDFVRARSLTRLPLPKSMVHQPVGAFDIDRPVCTVPGVMYETCSVGICVLSHGLAAGDQELRRLTTGVQVADPESIVVVPGHAAT